MVLSPSESSNYSWLLASDCFMAMWVWGWSGVGGLTHIPFTTTTSSREVFPVCLPCHWVCNWFPWQPMRTNVDSYRIVGNFQERKLLRIGENYNFRWENFRGLLAFAAPKVPHTQILRRKTFMNSHKTTKFAKVFSLESFPLYGMSVHIILVCKSLFPPPSLSPPFLPPFLPSSSSPLLPFHPPLPFSLPSISLLLSPSLLPSSFSPLSLLLHFFLPLLPPLSLRHRWT